MGLPAIQINAPKDRARRKADELHHCKRTGDGKHYRQPSEPRMASSGFPVPHLTAPFSFSYGAIGR
jgi:hypothetical protein